MDKESNSEYTEVVLSEIDRIESIMNEFLTLSKPQQDIEMKKHNVNDILKEVITFMTPEALLNKIQLRSNFNEPFLNVNCETKQLKQVFINLIKNAIEAMPNGGTIHFHTKVTKSGEVSIEVIDEGTGIPKEKLSRLGEPFFSNKEKGTGLGLMISNKIIANHKGTIQFFSEEGNGTTVQILLPSSCERS